MSNDDRDDPKTVDDTPAGAHKDPDATKVPSTTAADQRDTLVMDEKPVQDAVAAEVADKQPKEKKHKVGHDKKDKAEKKKLKAAKKAKKAQLAQTVELSAEAAAKIRSKQESKLAKQYEEKLQQELQIDAAELKAMKKKLVKAGGSPERGIETWFRLASRNLYTRRQIVDTKSNNLITINSVILSVILGTVYRELDDDPHLIIAVVPLVVASLISIAFAIFATKPRLRRGQFSLDDLESHQVSLMTFDDFYAMPGDQYQHAVNQVMEDRELLYATIKRDIYSVGIELSHRYLAIQRAYGVFLGGILLATLLFGICHAMY